MTKEEYLKLASEYWEELEKLENESNFYNYEKKFDSLMIDFGNNLLNKQMEGTGTDRRKKKSKNSLRGDKYA